MTRAPVARGSWPGVQAVDGTAFRRWSTSCLHVLRLTLGEHGDHYLQFRAHADGFNGFSSAFDNCLGVMQSAKDDVEVGLLAGMRDLAAAEVFDDLLGMAGYLLGEGYHLPAAALAGAVLEDSLRKLCANHNVAWTGDSSINKLNTALYTATPQVYGKVQMGQVEAWGKLRNAVDHHNFTNPSDIDPNDVRRMIDGVRDFIVKYLT